MDLLYLILYCPAIHNCKKGCITISYERSYRYVPKITYSKECLIFPERHIHTPKIFDMNFLNLRVALKVLIKKIYY